MPTLTVYPNATGDGWINNYLGGGQSWATIRGASAGTSVDKTYISVEAGHDATDYFIQRAFFPFDTSSLDDDVVISDAVFSLYATAVGANGDTTDAVLVSNTQASSSDLVVGDYDQVGTTSFARVTLATIAANLNAYNDWTCNAAGISNVSKTGYSYYSLVIGRDFDNSAPTADNQVVGQSTDGANDPKLVITYAPATTTSTTTSTTTTSTSSSTSTTTTSTSSSTTTTSTSTSSSTSTTTTSTSSSTSSSTTTTSTSTSTSTTTTSTSSSTTTSTSTTVSVTTSTSTTTTSPS